MFGIGGADKKQIAGISITSNLGLEVCVFDKDTNEVIKYGQKFLEYNMASKEIQDMNLFRSSVEGLFEELEISKTSASIYLVLPNVHFGFRSIDDVTIDKSLVENMILQDASESYIFKQEEPVSAWVDVNEGMDIPTRYIAHSSIQGKVVDAVQDAIMDIGGTIIGIESAASAIPRAIAATGLCDDVIENAENWDILQINPNGYTIFQMNGRRILDYLEIPFAIMSFENDEVYSALSSAAAQYLPNYPAKKLVIYSLTDNVSAALLKEEIIFDDDIVTIDANSHSAIPPVQVAQSVIKQKAASMSMNVLGAAIPKREGFATLNVLGDFNFDGIVDYGTFVIGKREIQVTSAGVKKFSLVLSALLLLATFIIDGSLFGADSFIKMRTKNVKDKITEIQAEISQLNTRLSANISGLIKQISDNNKLAINYYDSLSADIPPYVWLTYYINKDGKSVGVEGYSLEIKGVYEYYRNLKVMAPQSDIKLNKLQVFKPEETAGNSDIDSLVMNSQNSQRAFEFEISNTTYQRSFDERGNIPKITLPANGADADKEGADKKKKSTNKRQIGVRDMGAEDIMQNIGEDRGNSSFAAKIPDVPDVEINLKEVE